MYIHRERKVTQKINTRQDDRIYLVRIVFTQRVNNPLILKEFGYR